MNEGALRESFNMLMEINPAIEVYLLDPDGNILAYSAPPGKVKGSSVSLEPIRRFLDRAERLPILGDDLHQRPHQRRGRRRAGQRRRHQGDGQPVALRARDDGDPHRRHSGRALPPRGESPRRANGLGIPGVHHKTGKDLRVFRRYPE